MRARLFLLACVGMLCGSAAVAQTGEPFRFIHITDTHLTASGNVTPLLNLIQELKGMSPRPSFVIDTGDITEAGRPEEFQHFLQATSGLDVPFYAAPGNHDVRWSPSGKEAFEHTFRKLYQSFDHGGCHFVILDSTMLLEHWGHFDAAQLKWLDGDLKRLKKNVPVFLFFHHWVGRENPADPVVDNEDQLLRAIAPYNVRAMFIGHGHSDIQWKVNGIQCVMCRGLYQGSYDVIDVGPGSVRVSRARKEEPGKLTQIAEVRLDGTPRYHAAFGWDDVNISLLTRRTFMAELRNDRNVEKQGVKAEYSLDGGAPKMMIPDDRVDPGARDSREGRFVTRFETRGMSTGSHSIRIRLTGPNGEVYQRDEAFAVEQLRGQPKQDWSFAAGDSMQSSPALAGDTLYVSSHDGKLYALDAVTGKRRWTGVTRGPILSTPCVVGGAVYVGSLDHGLYAFDAHSGQQLWRFDTGAPLLATAASANGTVCIGGSGKIYGVDQKTGQRRWIQDAGSFFQSRAAAKDGVFYLGGWDNTLYALDAATGSPRWTTKMGRTNGGKGDISFYYSPAIASPAPGEGRVYVCTDDGVLHAINASTGHDDWTAKAPPGGDTFGYSSPLYVNGKVYVGGLGKNGDCYAVDGNTGDILWRCPTGSENYDSSPAQAGSLIAIGSVQGRISWIDPSDGKIRYQYALEPGHCFATPASDGKRTYITSMNNSAYALLMP